ncbi:MAG TPA: nucleotide exchange factor GrpE [Acidimicrobiales bacterium]|nr:nucleotide exchange factor GrpE [Acidimicrobiales bacterium]
MTSRPDPDLPGPPFDRGPGGIGENGDATDPAAFGEQADAVERAAEEILTDVAALTAERDEYLAALQRAQADFANYRKRVLRQQEEQGSRAALDLVAKLLPVLDTLDLAVAHLDKTDGDEPSTEAQTLRQARALLIDTLAKEGLERVDEEGVVFDPSVHDAVAHAPKADDEDGEPGSKIEEVLRSGYRWRGQMLRPAMVRVRG